MRCDECRFYVPHALKERAHKDDQTGSCRRYPPVRDMDWSAVIDDEDYGIEGAGCDWRAWEWPVVEAHQWCGEFKGTET